MHLWVCEQSSGRQGRSQFETVTTLQFHADGVLTALRNILSTVPPLSSLRVPTSRAYGISKGKKKNKNKEKKNAD